MRPRIRSVWEVPAPRRSLAACYGSVALTPFTPHYARMETSRAEYLRQSLRDYMPRGLYVGGGMVMCAVTGVPLLGVYVDDDGIADDFKCADGSSKFVWGTVRPC